jgi:hypothetical protein
MSRVSAAVSRSQLEGRRVASSYIMSSRGWAAIAVRFGGPAEGVEWPVRMGRGAAGPGMGRGVTAQPNHLRPWGCNAPRRGSGLGVQLDFSGFSCFGQCAAAIDISFGAYDSPAGVMLFWTVGGAAGGSRGARAVQNLA